MTTKTQLPQLRLSFEGQWDVKLPELAVFKKLPSGIFQRTV